MKLKSIFTTKTTEERLYKVPCPVIGLTGGIATGKSSVTRKLEDLGLKVICADKLVKKVYDQSETFDFIKSKFPEAISSENMIDFKILRELAFQSINNKQLLEEFIYKRLPKEFAIEFKQFDSPELLIYDVPLLFEKKMSDMFDLTICVYASRDIQIERMVRRDSITKDLAQSILNNQMPIDEKKELSDFTIDNSKTIEHLELEVEALMAILLD